MSLKTFTDAYIETLIWSEQDDDTSLDAPLSDDARTAIQRDCKAFYEANEADLDERGNDEQSGHDFALTRNRHGAGFWDRGLGALGDRLTEASHRFGEQPLYIGDDGEIYTHS